MHSHASYSWEVKENKEHKSIFQDQCSMKVETITEVAVSDGDIYACCPVSKSSDRSDNERMGEGSQRKNIYYK